MHLRALQHPRFESWLPKIISCSTYCLFLLTTCSTQIYCNKTSDSYTRGCSFVCQHLQDLQASKNLNCESKSKNRRKTINKHGSWFLCCWKLCWNINEMFHNESSLCCSIKLVLLLFLLCSLSQVVDMYHFQLQKTYRSVSVSKSTRTESQ